MFLMLLGLHMLLVILVVSSANPTVAVATSGLGIVLNKLICTI